MALGTTGTFSVPSAGFVWREDKHTSSEALVLSLAGHETAPARTYFARRRAGYVSQAGASASDS